MKMKTLMAKIQKRITGNRTDFNTTRKKIIWKVLNKVNIVYIEIYKQ